MCSKFMVHVLYVVSRHIHITVARENVFSFVAQDCLCHAPDDCKSVDCKSVD